MEKKCLGEHKVKAIQVFLSFFIPFLIILVSLVGLGITPFDNKTLLISDANGLYVNFLSYTGRLIGGMEELTYSFEKGLGGNMTGHLNGILLTPFGFLFSLVSISDYPIAYTFVSALNFSLCGLTMYILLADIHGQKKSNLIFSTCYALVGFNVANVFQAVFFCAAAPLPIMVLGLRKLFQGKSPIVYICSIAYGLLTNAYFGFVLCVASVLFFLTGFILHRQEIHPGKLFLHYAFASVCGGLLPVVLWLPGFLSMQGGRLEQTSITDFSFWENMPFLQMGAKLFTGANSTSELVNGLPNIFVGILPLALVILFFMNKGIDRRRKGAAGFLIGFYLISFWIVAFNMLMHGGTTTNWFNYRYSYVFSFILLLVASELWERIEAVPIEDIKRCAGIMVIASILILFQKYEFLMGGAVLLDFALLGLIFLGWQMHRKRPEYNSKKMFEIVTLVVVCINLFMNYRLCTKNIMEWGTTLSDYRETVEQVDPIVQGIKDSDDSFYRMEINRQRSKTTGNDPMLYGYNGVGHGGSNERNFVREGLNKLGIPWFDMRNYYADGIPAATDALLGIKYVIAEEDLTEEKGYLNLTKADGWNIYVDANAQQIAMITEGDISEIETDYADVFNNLNRVWGSLGATSDVLIEETGISFETHNLSDPMTIDARNARAKVESELTSISTGDGSATNPAKEEENSPNGRALKEPPQEQSYIEYHWTAARDGSYYSYNRSGLADNYGSYDPVLRYEGYYHKGDSVTGYLPVPGSYVPENVLNDVAGRFRAACADEEALTAACNAVRARPVTLVKEKETRLVGDFTSNGSQKLLFTIPWDAGWTCYVDGEKAELQQALGVFMTVDTPEGHHTFEIRYVPAGLKTGAIISAATLVVTLLYLLLGRRYAGWHKVRREAATNDTV